MLEKITDSPKTPKSKITTSLGIVLIIIILALLTYGGIISYRGVTLARQKYFQEVANLKKKDVKITIIEGWRREQIAAKLVDLKILSSPDEFLKLTENLEGQLFPDTYRFFKNSAASGVIAKMTENFTKKTSGLSINNLQSTITLASIVEREAAGDEERAPIAGVYKNRIDSDMKLEADPTAQYARDSNLLQATSYKLQAVIFWQPITKEEINAADSPYNTYKYDGLPPRPICNPGLKSIEAALNPEFSQNFYFFHDSNGAIRFSRNVADHNYQKKIYGVRK